MNETAPVSETNELGGDDLQLLKRASEGYERLKSEVGKVIVGQESIVRPALAAVFSQGHTLIIGVPGLAKTLLIKTLADALSWEFKRIQFTPDLMPSDIIGMELLHEAADGAREMKFVPGPIFANIILADEINRTPPKTQSALLEAMQEYTVTSMGQVHDLEKPFIVFATQNPIEQEGTYPLPEAQLDRFMFSLWMTYPTEEQEQDIVMSTTDDRHAKVEPVFSIQDIIQYQHLVRRIPASRHVVKYAVELARYTRPELDGASTFIQNFVSWGAGPRAGQNMILGAKALALIDGQPSVTANHVRQIAPLVLRHRILANYNAAGEGIDSAAIVQHVLDSVGEPIYG